MREKTHLVITCVVILYPGSAKSLARPKSAILSCPSADMSKLFGFKSYSRGILQLSSKSWVKEACSLHGAK